MKVQLESYCSNLDEIMTKTSTIRRKINEYEKEYTHTNTHTYIYIERERGITITLLYTRNYYNIVNQLYFYLK